MSTTRKPDIFTVRPRDEDHSVSVKAITDELREAGLEVSEVARGYTQPDGSTVYFAYLEAS